MHVYAPVVRFCYVEGAATLYEQPPGYATAGSAGIDLRACPASGQLDASGALVIEPGGRASIPTGIAVEPIIGAEEPPFAGFVYSRSGLGAVSGLTVAQGVGVIDPDYRGEIKVVLLNTSAEPRRVLPGDRIAQLVFQPVYSVRLEECRSLGQSERDAGGFGHTGLR